MRSFFQNKYWILTLSIVALGALTVLSLGLHDISFHGAQPLFRKESEATLAPGERITMLSDISITSQVIFWVAATMMVVLVGLLLDPESRKKLFYIFMRVVVTYWAMYFFFKYYGDQLVSLFNFNFQAGDPNGAVENANAAPPPVFVPPQPSPWVSYLVSIVIALFLIYILWRFYARWKRILDLQARQKPLDEIAKIARSSLRDLNDGSDSTDVIMNCYFRMSRAVSDKHHLHRMDSMTPAEFAFQLEQAGLPGDAVQRLTRLFEGVRYGERRSGPKDVNEAVACLTSILVYCGEPV